ncbi:MAG: hypothetical protein ACXAC7_01005 [Candidatus Hodarchaeales archaeon]|jgi:DNA-binding MarR family transcriptional regulator
MEITLLLIPVLLGFFLGISLILNSIYSFKRSNDPIIKSLNIGLGVISVSSFALACSKIENLPPGPFFYLGLVFFISAIANMIILYGLSIVYNFSMNIRRFLNVFFVLHPIALISTFYFLPGVKYISFEQPQFNPIFIIIIFIATCLIIAVIIFTFFYIFSTIQLSTDSVTKKNAGKYAIGLTLLFFPLYFFPLFSGLLSRSDYPYFLVGVLLIGLCGIVIVISCLPSIQDFHLYDALVETRSMQKMMTNIEINKTNEITEGILLKLLASVKALPKELPDASILKSLTQRDISTLFFIADNHPKSLTLSSIHKSLDLSWGTVKKSIDKLGTNQLIVKTIDLSDTRKYKISLTTQGLNFMSLISNNIEK